jgi:hypothetical protein
MTRSRGSGIGGLNHEPEVYGQVSIFFFFKAPRYKENLFRRKLNFL